MRIQLLIVGAMLALVTGCDSKSPPPANPGATTAGTTTKGDVPDPCSLLTGAEVDAATGKDFGEGAINATVTQDFVAACDWNASGIDTVQVYVTSVNSYDSNKETAASVYDSVDDITIAGATRAFVIKSGFLIGMDEGTYYLQVSYISANPDVSAAVKDLAGKAAARLG